MWWVGVLKQSVLRTVSTNCAHEARTATGREQRPCASPRLHSVCSQKRNVRPRQSGRLPCDVVVVLKADSPS